MISKGHCMMNPDDLDQFKRYYDYSEENKLIFDKYITHGRYTIDDLKDFETIEVVKK